MDKTTFIAALIMNGFELKSKMMDTEILHKGTGTLYTPKGNLLVVYIHIHNTPWNKYRRNKYSIEIRKAPINLSKKQFMSFEKAYIYLMDIYE